VWVIPWQHVVFHFGEGASKLYACRPASDNDDIPVAIVAAAALDNQFFEREQDMVADADGFLGILHSERQVLHFFVAEEIGAASGCNHEFVVAESAVGSDDFVFVRKYGLHLCHPELDVMGALEDFPERKGNIGRLDTSAGNLIEKRLEHMMVHLVDQHYFLPFPVVEFPCQLQTGKAATDDDNFVAHFLGFVIKLTIIFHLRSGSRETPEALCVHANIFPFLSP